MAMKATPHSGCAVPQRTSAVKKFCPFLRHHTPKQMSPAKMARVPIQLKLSKKTWFKMVSMCMISKRKVPVEALHPRVVQLRVISRPPCAW